MKRDDVAATIGIVGLLAILVLFGSLYKSEKQRCREMCGQDRPLVCGTVRHHGLVAVCERGDRSLRVVEGP